MKRIFTIIAIATASSIICFEASLRWLDAKSWESYLDNRWAIKIIAQIYDLYPFTTQTDDIRRTIKIAHFLALARIDSKPLNKVLLDFNEAQTLLDRFIKNRTSTIESEDLAELILERVIILNRMNAILAQSPKPLPINIDAAKKSARDLLPSIQDRQTKQALEKEIYLYDVSKQKALLTSQGADRDLFSAIDAYHFGLAACAMQNEFGATLIHQGLKSIQKSDLISITLRNIDHPLIAASAFVSGSACAAASMEIQTQLGT